MQALHAPVYLRLIEIDGIHGAAEAFGRWRVIKAYTAANLPDAHILTGLLHAEGIEARIFNASAQGGLGEIPFMQAYPEIWLLNPDDLDRARQLFEAFERPVDGAVPVRCVSCGEDNPSSFDICWNCQAALRTAPSGYSAE